MTTAVPGGDVRVRRGVGGSLLALARAIAFLGPLLLGTVLLVVIAGSVVVTVLALGHSVQDLLSHRSLGMGNGELGQYLEEAVFGLLCCLFVLPVALLATRRLAMADAAAVGALVRRADLQRLPATARRPGGRRAGSATSSG